MFPLRCSMFVCLYCVYIMITATGKIFSQLCTQTLGYNLIYDLTFAPVELDGSSKSAQIFGLVRCQQVSSPLSKASSKPKRRAIASSDGCSSSNSNLSNIARVVCKE